MNILDNVIYLDNAFIVEAYQKITKKDAAVKYTKMKNVSIGISAVASAGASLRESFEYPINAHAMYKEITKELNNIKVFEFTDETTEFPDLFWFEGTLGITQFTTKPAKSEPRIHYAFSTRSENTDKQLYLSINDVYFSSGYDLILEQADAAAYGFTIKVKMLLKFLGTARENILVAPMIIIKK